MATPDLIADSFTAASTLAHVPCYLNLHIILARALAAASFGSCHIIIALHDGDTASVLCALRCVIFTKSLRFAEFAENTSCSSRFAWYP